MPNHLPTRMVAMTALSVALLVASAGCLTIAAGVRGVGDGRIQIVAAENFWGSIAQQIGGDRVRVDSIISNPDVDPHSYEPRVSDARALADAGLVIVNGAGYDAWAGRLLAAAPAAGRIVLSVGDLVGVRPGGNPHRWYSPADVHRVIAQIRADLSHLDPAHASAYTAGARAYQRTGLAEYDALIAGIRARYAGVPVGASESIAAPLAEALGLRLLTPPRFLNAISEGAEPEAADTATIDHQINDRLIKIYIYNSQNGTPDVQAQVAAARHAGIPIAAITETLEPAGRTFQDWQVGQLREIQQALHQATGK